MSSYTHRNKAIGDALSTLASDLMEPDERDRPHQDLKTPHGVPLTRGDVVAVTGQGVCANWNLHDAHVFTGSDPQTVRQLWKALKTPTQGVVVWDILEPHEHQKEILNVLLDELRLSHKALVLITYPTNTRKAHTFLCGFRMEKYNYKDGLYVKQNQRKDSPRRRRF